MNDLEKNLHRKRKSAYMLGIISFFTFFLMPQGRIGATWNKQLLRVTVLSPYSIKLEWDDVMEGERGFRIERAVDSGQFVLKAVVSSNTVSYVDHGVSPGHVYTYRVMAMDKDNNIIPYTGEVSLTASMIVSPDSLELTSPLPDRMELSWTYPGYERYDTVIERREGAKSEWVFVARVPAGIYRYLDTNLAPGVQYFYRIKAAAGPSIYSKNYPNDYGKAAYTLLGKPAGLQGHAVSDTQIYITWEYEGDATNFLVERKTNDGNFTVIGTVPAGNRWFYDRGLAKGSFYTYRVKAVKGGSESAYSNEITINCTYLNPPIAIYANAVHNPINTMTGTTGAIPGSASAMPVTVIELKWENSLLNPGALVEIWRKAGFYEDWELYVTLERNHNTFIDNNVEQGMLYSYKLRSVLPYSKAYSVFSNTASIRVDSCTPPGMTDYSVIDENSIMLMWDYAYDRETWFIIETRENEDNDWREIAYLPPSTRVYKVESLLPEKVYFIRVRAFNNISMLSSYGEEVMVVTRVPEAPSGVKAEALSSKQVKLTWSGRPIHGIAGIGSPGNTCDKAGFIVERKEEGQEFFKVVAKLDASANSYVDSGLLPSRRYTYRVKAYNKAGVSDYSQEIRVITKRRIFFQDISPFHPARQAIEELAERGLITGKTSEYFDPEGLISRAEFTCLVIRSFKLDGPRIGSFNDVIYGDDFYDEIMIAKSLGVITGDSQNNFYPDWPLTRGEMAIIIDRVLKAADKALPGDIAEILETRIDTESIPDYTIPVFAFLVSENVFYLDRNSLTIHPGESVKRAEAAMAIYKLLENFD